MYRLGTYALGLSIGIATEIIPHYFLFVNSFLKKFPPFLPLPSEIMPQAIKRKAKSRRRRFVSMLLAVIAPSAQPMLPIRHMMIRRGRRSFFERMWMSAPAAVENIKK